MHEIVYQNWQLDKNDICLVEEHKNFLSHREFWPLKHKGRFS